VPKREPSETICTHCGEVRPFALRGCSRRRLSFSRGAPPHFHLIKCPPSFRLFLFHTPDYLALLQASEFHHCDKLLLSLLRPIGSCQSQLFVQHCCYVKAWHAMPHWAFPIRTSAPSLSHVRSKIAIIVSIINRFMTSMTYALRDLSDMLFYSPWRSSTRRGTSLRGLV
jgi:hypothetical protein